MADVPMITAGTVPREKYNQVKRARDTAERQHAQMLAELSQVKAERHMLRVASTEAAAYVDLQLQLAATRQALDSLTRAVAASTNAGLTAARAAHDFLTKTGAAPAPLKATT